MGSTGGVFHPGPQAVGDARFGPPCASRTLFGRRPRGRTGRQTGEPAARVVAGRADLAGVDHDPDAFDGEAGLGDVGGEHHPAAPRRRGCQREILLNERQCAEQRPDIDVAVADVTLQQRGDPTDVGGAREEHQDVALVVAQCLVHGGHRRLGDAGSATAVLLDRAPAEVDRPGATFTEDDGRGFRRVAEHGGDPFGVGGGRHGEDAQVRAQRRARVEGEREGQVRVQVAFVDLVEDHQPDPGKGRVPLQPTGEDALGDHLDAGAGPDVTFVTGAVADDLADVLANQVGHASCRGAGGEPARLEDHDPSIFQPRLVEQAQGHDRGLACTGRRLQYRGGGLLQRRAQLVDHFFDR